MAILVVCTKCRTRFQVSDKFAGRSGPCPKCKNTIKIPTAKEAVKIYGEEGFTDGGRNAAGQLVLKPIARTETRLEPVTAAAIGAGALFALALAWLMGGLLQENLIVRTVGLLLVTPAMVRAAYAFLRDDELEPYAGRSLYLRIAACTLVYVGLWGVYGQVSDRLLTGEIWNWVFVAPPFLLTGALAALACFDLDLTSGFFHYAFYVLLTLVLRWAAGMGWLWQPPPPIA